MKAARLKTGLTKYSLIAALLSSGLGIACGAQPAAAPANSTPAAAPDLSAIAATANGETPVSPQLQAAADRVTKAKTDLDTAHKRLNASKAVLKAADAEFKAAKADQQALSLQTQAQALATASGMNGSAATPTTTAPTSAAPVPSDSSPNNVGQSFDFSGGSAPAPYTAVPTPGK